MAVNLNKKQKGNKINTIKERKRNSKSSSIICITFQKRKQNLKLKYSHYYRMRGVPLIPQGPFPLILKFIETILLIIHRRSTNPMEFWR